MLECSVKFTGIKNPVAAWRKLGKLFWGRNPKHKFVYCVAEYLRSYIMVRRRSHNVLNSVFNKVENSMNILFLTKQKLQVLCL